MYVGIDIGTSSIKAVLGLDTGALSLTEIYAKEMFNGGYHRVELFKRSLKSLLGRIAGICQEKSEEIEGIGFSGHGPSIMLVDSAGLPLTDILTWQDGSSFQEAAQLRRLNDEFDKDGTSFEAKLYKFFKEFNGTFPDGAKVLYPKDYAIFLLTGELILDFSTATTISFFDSVKSLFKTSSTGIPEHIFPRIVNSWEIAGSTVSEFSRECGLSRGIPVVAGGIDAWCEALGAGAVEEGMMVDGSGTSTCITCCRSKKAGNLYHVIPDMFLDIETMSSTGASIAWLLKLLGCSMDELKQINSFIPLPVIYLPYLNGERSPVWDERASASFIGLKAGNDRADLIRIVLQGISFGTKQNIDIIRSKSIGAGEKVIRAVGGGANNKVLLQYKADITGFRYLSLKETNAAPLGAMILAAFGCGSGSIDELIEKWVRVNFEVKPNNRYVKTWDRLFSLYKEYYGKVMETSHSLFEIAEELGFLTNKGVL